MSDLLHIILVHPSRLPLYFHCRHLNFHYSGAHNAVMAQENAQHILFVKVDANCYS